MKDLIKNGINGYLSEDDNELADRIVELVSDSGKQAEFSENASSLSIAYNDINTYLSNVSSVYEKISK